MNHRGNDDEAGAEEVQAADDAAEGEAIGDVADAVVGVLGRRHVVHRQHDAGDQLDAEQEQQDAAGDEPPADAGGQALVQQVGAAGAEAGARVEPVGEAAQRTDHSSTSTCSPSTRVGSLSSGLGGGPAFTAPVRSNTPPWQGHFSV